MRRLSGRRTCAENGHVFHVEFDPPENEGVCDIDGSALQIRDDDKPEVIKRRLENYRDQTEPLISYYDAKGLLRRVDGAAPAGGGQRPDPGAALDHEARRGHLSVYRMIIRKTPEQVEQMAVAGEILVRCLRMLASKARPGVSTLELDEAAERFIRSQDAEPAFKGYRGFPGSICASPNSMVVHGIPGPYELKRGDVLSLDVGVVKDGWVADAAITVPIGSIAPEARSLLETTKASLLEGVEQMRAGQPPRRRLGGDPAPGRARRLLGDPHPGRPRDRPRHARGPADPELRRARQGPGAGGGDGVRDRADGQRRRPAGADRRRRLVGLLPGRLARRPLRVHRRGDLGGAAHPDALARGAEIPAWLVPGGPRSPAILPGRPEGRFELACGSTPGAAGLPISIRIRGR